MKAKKIAIYLSSIVALLSFVVIFIYIRKVGVIPNKYVFLFTIIELLLLILGFFLGSLKKIYFYIISILIFLLLTIGNSFGIYYVKHLNKFIDNSFTGEIINTTNFYVITSVNNNVNSLDEVTIDKVINYHSNSKNIEKAIDKLNDYEFVAIDSLKDYLLNNKETNTYLLISSSSFIAYTEADEEISEDNYKIIYEFDIVTTEKRNDEEKDVYNILILGKDFSNERDDLNMLVTVNTKTRKILITGMPRDYYIQVHGKNYGNSLTFMFEYGEEVQMKSIEEHFDTTIDYKFVLYARNLVDVVDTIGGVEFCTDVSFTTTHAQVLTYDDSKGNKLRVTKGCHTLNGIEALTVARERVAFNPKGDHQRQENCRQLLINILKKIASLSSLSNYSEILDSLNGLYQTTMNRNTAVRLIRSVLENNDYEIIQQYVSGSQDKNPIGKEVLVTWAVVPDKEQLEAAKAKIKEILNEE